MLHKMASVGKNMATSFFARGQRFAPDPIFALTAQFHQDEFPNKVNLGQGAYRDGQGLPWVLPSVRQARKRLEQGLTHEYLPILGHKEFRRAAAEVVLGQDILNAHESKIATCHSLSGTGSLYLLGSLIAQCRSPKPKVYIPEPSWSNHFQVFSGTGLECHSFRYYDPAKKTIDMASYREMLQTAEAGSIVVLHACAHNPTGCDPTQDQWREIGQIMKDRSLFPVFDSAYLGFNSGSVDEDAFAIRHFVGDLGLEAGVCISFAKSMGLYAERVGCLMVCTASEDAALDCSSMLERIQRTIVSNPPAYGAKIAHLVLSDKDLRKQWFDDLVEMSGRIKTMRQRLRDALEQDTPGRGDHIVRQSGMFGFLGLSPAVVKELREKYHIYMADSSRISVAGLNDGNVEYVGKSISECVQRDGA